MTRLSLFTFLALLAFSCCDEDEHMDDPQIENFLPMEVGNYWVYQYSQEQQDGSFKTNSFSDSVVIVGTELMNDAVFYKFISYRIPGDNAFTYYRRDSVGYITNEKGAIYYTPNDNEGVIQTAVTEHNQIPDAITITYTQSPEIAEVTVPAGTFSTKQLVGELTVNPDFLPKYDCDKNNVTHYAESIGIVKKEEHYTNSCWSLNRELIRYNVQ